MDELNEASITAENETATATATEPRIPSLEEFHREHSDEIRAESYRTGENQYALAKARYFAEHPPIGGVAVEKMRLAQEAAALAAAESEAAELHVRELAAQWDSMLERRTNLKKQIGRIDGHLERIDDFDFDAYFGELAEKVALDSFGMNENQDWPWMLGYAVEKRRKFLPPLRKKLSNDLAQLETEIENFRAENAK